MYSCTCINITYGGISRSAPSPPGSVREGSSNGRSSKRLSPMITATSAANAPTPPLPPVASPKDVTHDCIPAPF